jgi:hypothetical protein
MFQKIAKKKQKETDKVLRKAITVFTCTINKQIQEVKVEGVYDRVTKKNRGSIFNNTKPLDLRFLF